MLKMIETWSGALNQLLPMMLEVSVFEKNNATGNSMPDQVGEVVFVPMADGRVVKSIAIGFEEKGKAYIVQFSADVSIFAQLQQQLAQIVQQPVVSEAKGAWQQQITEGIQAYLQEQRCTLATITRQQKRELVFQLKQQGLLDYKEATVYLAQTLNLSRATIYNYLQSAQTIRHLTIHQVNSFSEQPGGGNPAGVVLDAENLTTTSMQQLARELNYSETAFLIPADKADFGLRYFTREGIEVNFCGHSTVGTLYMLAKEAAFNIDKPGEYPLTIATQVGLISTKILINQQRDITVQYEAPVVQLKNVKYTQRELADNMGIALSSLGSDIPLMLEKTNQALFIKAKSLKDLENLQCDFRKLKIFMKQHDLITCCVWVDQTFNAQNDIHMRCFCPSVGVNEDPFTGSVLGGLAAYLHKNHLIDGRKKQFQVEQGHFVSRPGEVTVRFELRGNKYQVEVIAKARHFFSTEVALVN